LFRVLDLFVNCVGTEDGIGNEKDAETVFFEGCVDEIEEVGEKDNAANSKDENDFIEAEITKKFQLISK
jgi:hypothetical protein